MENEVRFAETVLAAGSTEPPISDHEPSCRHRSNVDSPRPAGTSLSSYWTVAFR
jgi:hypothetical protein